MPQSTLKNYPQGLPYRSPQELAAKTVWRQRWVLLLACTAAAGLAVLLVAALFCFTGNNPLAAEVPGPVQPLPAPTPPVVVSAPAPPPAKPASVVSESVLPSPAAEKKTTKPAVLPTPATPSFARDRYLEAMGGLAAAHLYQSFLNIGLLADAVENEFYSKPQAEKTLASISQLMKLVDGQLDKVAKTGLDAEDQQALERIRKLTNLLRTQASALTAYWTTGDQDQAERYHEARAQAWSGISEVLGLEDAMDKK